MIESIITFIKNNILVFDILFVALFCFIMKDLFKNMDNYSKKASKESVSMRYSRGKRIYRNICKKVIAFLLKIPILQDALLNIKINAKNQYAVDDEESDIIVGEILSYLLLFAIFIYPLLLLYFKDLVLSLFAMIMLVMYVSNRKKGDKIKFLSNLEDMVGQLVHLFNAEHGNIDRAFTRLFEINNPLKNHFRIMYEYLKEADISSDKERVIAAYNKISPSRYLRIIFNYIHLTYQYGDTKDLEGSLFNRNMLAIQREINGEMEKKSSIRDKIMGEALFIIMPIFFLPAVKWYLLEYFTFDGFEYMKEFLYSSIGYATSVFCALVSVVCMYLYTKVVYETESLETKQFISWEERFLNKFRFVRKFIYKVVPKDSPKHKKITEKLIRSGSRDTVEVFYLKKLLITGVALITCVVAFTVESKISENTIRIDLYQGINKTEFNNIVLFYDDVEAYKALSVENDKKVLNAFEGASDFMSLSDDEKTKAVTNYLEVNNIDYGSDNEIAVQRLVYKINLLHKDSSLLRILCIGIITLISFFIGDLGVFIKKTMNQEMSLYDETMGIQTIAILLKNHRASNPKMMIEWFKNFSVLFYTPLQEACDNLSEKSLTKVNEVIKYKPFNELIDSLIMAYNGTDIKKSFAGIEQKQIFQEKIRERNNQKIVNIKVDLVKFLVYISMSIVVVLYLFLPMIIAALDMFNNLQL